MLAAALKLGYMLVTDSFLLATTDSEFGKVMACRMLPS
jgi:hypothetical protein